VKHLVEARAVGGHHFGVILRQLRHQKETEHATFAVTAKGQALSVSGGLQ
jgi:hypothetical protein